MESQWRVVREERVVYHLFRDGKPIIDHEGRVMEYDTEEEAIYRASHWEHFRAPTYAELRATSDSELVARMKRMESGELPGRWGKK